MKKSISKVLLIFTKNPILGTVKTRIAKKTGAPKALEIYQWLLNHTQSLCTPIIAEKYVFYNQFIPEEDIWPTDFKKCLQVAETLGEKMERAFANIFQNGAAKVIIIGSDCASLKTTIIEEAFTQLDQYEFVLGPAEDGGYYLLGMNYFYPSLFSHKKWSTSSVLADTIKDIEKLSASYSLLPTLSDIDHLEDWKAFLAEKN